MLSSSLPSACSPACSRDSLSLVDPEPLCVESLIINQDEVKELQCGICLQLLNKPRQCTNGHLFCFVCILQAMEKNMSCPTCRVSMTHDTLARSIFVEKYILNLKMRCKYYFTYDDASRQWVEDPEGCKQVITLENRLAHERDCGFAPIACKFDRSCGMHRRRTIEEHERICPWRPVPCKHCHNDIKFRLLEDHYAECPSVPLACPSCNKEIPRGRLEKHRLKECDEEEIACEFAEQGCERRMQRKDLLEHLRNESAEHLLLLKQYYDEKTRRMVKHFEETLQTKDDHIAKLEKAVKESHTKVTWKIKNFSGQRKKSYLQSNKFTFADFNWFIGFYTDGDNEESRGFFSIYLFLDVSDVPKAKSVKIEYFLTFVNHASPGESVRKEFKTTFPIKGGQGWGDRRAVQATKIDSENGFLKGDVLVVECELTAKKIFYAV